MIAKEKGQEKKKKKKLGKINEINIIKIENNIKLQNPKLKLIDNRKPRKDIVEL